VQEALDLLEYVNHPGGTSWSDLRAAYGSPAPYDVRTWCLGNEMDGLWQLGHMPADEYGQLAARTAAAMKAYDPALELVVCGSSSSAMPTFGSWERTVLEHTFDHVDAISCHAYYMQRAGETADFLASAVDMDRFIETVVVIADEVAAARGSSRRIGISFDEWNVWYQGGGPGPEPVGWPTAPPLQEDDFDATDAVVVGSLLMSLLRHCDRIVLACLAQLVNVVAPIRTSSGRGAWRQPTFHPFALTARHARGYVLRGVVDTPTVPSERWGDVPAVEAVVTHDASAGTASVFVLNRSLDEGAMLHLDLAELGDLHVEELLVLRGADGGRSQPEVRPLPGSYRQEARGVVIVELPAVAWATLTLA
jgi:alpha-N-arabinofuranosidase